MSSRSTLSKRRQKRVRFQVKSKASGRPRLSVFRSNANIYAQVIDDAKGVTLASASSLSVKSKSANIETAEKVGAEVASIAIKAGVKQVVFDRGAYLYHGKVKALAEKAREGGLEF